MQLFQMNCLVNCVKITIIDMLFAKIHNGSSAQCTGTHSHASIHNLQYTHTWIVHKNCWPIMKRFRLVSDIYITYIECSAHFGMHNELGSLAHSVHGTGYGILASITLTRCLRQRRRWRWWPRRQHDARYTSKHKKKKTIYIYI